jgi:hypothetical protein
VRSRSHLGKRDVTGLGTVRTRERVCAPGRRTPCSPRRLLHPSNHDGNRFGNVGQGLLNPLPSCTIGFRRVRLGVGEQKLPVFAAP